MYFVKKSWNNKIFGNNFINDSRICLYVIDGL